MVLQGFLPGGQPNETEVEYNMEEKLNRSAERVQAALDECGVSLSVLELAASTRTSQEAAAAVGCEVGQIAKSVIFRGKVTDKPVLVIACGNNRVDEKKLAEYCGEAIAKSDAAFVMDQTGYAIGGVPPIGHKKQLETYIDEELLTYPEVWGAAGTPHAVFKLTPEMLLKITRGKLVQIK